MEFVVFYWACESVLLGNVFVSVSINNLTFDRFLILDRWYYALFELALLYWVIELVRSLGRKRSVGLSTHLNLVGFEPFNVINLALLEFVHLREFFVLGVAIVYLNTFWGPVRIELRLHFDIYVLGWYKFLLHHYWGLTSLCIGVLKLLRRFQVELLPLLGRICGPIAVFVHDLGLLLLKQRSCLFIEVYCNRLTILPLFWNRARSLITQILLLSSNTLFRGCWSLFLILIGCLLFQNVLHFHRLIL